MPAVKLPMTFANSFWSQDYRRGLETLYGKLDEVCISKLSIFVVCLILYGRVWPRISKYSPS